MRDEFLRLVPVKAHRVIARLSAEADGGDAVLRRELQNGDVVGDDSDVLVSAHLVDDVQRRGRFVHEHHAVVAQQFCSCLIELELFLRVDAHAENRRASIHIAQALHHAAVTAHHEPKILHCVQIAPHRRHADKELFTESVHACIAALCQYIHYFLIPLVFHCYPCLKLIIFDRFSILAPNLAEVKYCEYNTV